MGRWGVGSQRRGAYAIPLFGGVTLVTVVLRLTMVGTNLDTERPTSGGNRGTPVTDSRNYGQLLCFIH